MESNSTAFLIKIKLRHSLGRPSRSDFVQSEVVWLSKYLRCRSIGSVSRDWVGLPPDFHWADNSDEPQDSEFSQQRLRELLESPLRSPEDNLPEAPPIPDIRYVMFGSLDTGELGIWETGSNSHFIR